MPNNLQVHSIYKSFGSTRALENVSFNIHESEVVALLGPSGCGKSTLLNLIAGLDHPDSGHIFWNGTPLEHTPVHQRNFGLMFQDFALFPHYNIFDNIAFGLKMGHLPKDEIQSRVTEVLDLVGLPGFEKRDIHTLSGGESQRIALARAIAPYPSLLMLDEPLGSLDRNLRERLVVDLGRILQASRQTAIYVTHDQEEAFAIADRVIIMNAGQIAQIGAPQEIYRYPACQFVASFLGMSNQVPGEIVTRDSRSFVRTILGEFPTSFKPVDHPVTVLLRPDTVSLGSGEEAQLSGVVEEINFRGNTSKLTIAVAGQRFVFNFPSNTDLPLKGDTVTISFDPQQAIQIFPEKCTTSEY